MKKVLEGERRWTTVLFTDMVGFSGVSEKLGAERVYQLLSEVIALATDAIEAHGGHMVDFAGDSIQAVFGAPIALENASLMACSAALDFISSLNAHSAQFELEYGIRPQFRIGIAGGTIILGQLGLNEKLDVTVMGEAVNEAARLEGIAGPGSVLISSAVFGQVEGYVEAADLGEKELKGFARKTRVYELNAVLGNVSRFEGLKRRGLTKLVGREQELAELIQAVETPASEAQFVTVRAQAGIGKSRLVHEFTNRISDKTPVLMGQCNPSTSQVAFGPFIDLLRRMVGVSKDEEPKAVATKLHAALAKKHDYDKLLRLLSGGSAAADVNGQNDLHGDALRMRKLMEEIMIDLASDLKHVLIIEDAHWIDSTSNELLSQLAARTDVDRMLFILTTRPGYSPSWQGSQNAREIVVKPLGRESIWELAAKQLENANYAPELIDIVISKSEGNPLFAEEIIRYLKSSNRLIETPNGMSLPE
ncbi:MAG: AAA family ATPase, partial [Pseudomonadota bacterium]